VIPDERAHLIVSAVTHPGMKGKNNEDRYGVSAYRLSQEEDTPSLLAIVADGVGGHRAGDVAAEMAVEMISREVAQSDASQPIDTLREAIVQTSQTIYERAYASPELHGMSTTCACAWVIGDRLFTASVGDSRIYLVRNRQIFQVTTDHTWVQEAIDAGALTPAQAQRHPNAHVIRRHLGSQQPVVPDFRMRLRPGDSDAKSVENQGMHLRPGDQLLLCSDGLTDLVGDGDILRILLSRSLEAALNELIKLANSRGGHDNITIIAMQVPTWQRTRLFATPPAWNPARRSFILWGGLGLAAVVLVGAAIAAGLFWYRDRSPLVPSPAPLSTQELISNPLDHIPSSEGATPTVTLPTSSPVTFTASPGTLSSPYPTPVSATYTPWPTNTLQLPAVIKAP
jgi:serine/threonine protein phosphatase PrpC